MRPPPSSTLFPYTTLFRSVGHTGHADLAVEWGATVVVVINPAVPLRRVDEDRKSTRLNSSHVKISYAVFCLKKKKKQTRNVSLKGAGGKPNSHARESMAIT